MKQPDSMYFTGDKITTSLKLHICLNVTRQSEIKLHTVCRKSITPNTQVLAANCYGIPEWWLPHESESLLC